MQEDMILIIDFDGVLFDDVRFKKDYTALFGRFGILPNEYQETYEKSKIKAGGYYAPKTHLAVLKTTHPQIDADRIQKEILQFARKSRSYIYKDAEKFLIFCATQDIALFLLSAGLSFQREKIRASALAHFFKKIVVVKSASKKESVERIIKKERRVKTIFIDDKKEVVDEIKKSVPDIFVVQMMRRKNQEKSKYTDRKIKNLSAAEKICARIIAQKS